MTSWPHQFYTKPIYFAGLNNITQHIKLIVMSWLIKAVKMLEVC